MIKRSQTAEEFANTRHELPDGGRWSELILGEPVELDPPPPKHGTAVLNITKAFADYVQVNSSGYACFELGLIVHRAPDSVYCPPISYFVTGNRWDEMDKVITETRPALIVEMASSRDRCQNLVSRVKAYLEWGVGVVWVVETDNTRIAVHSASGTAIFTEEESIEATDEWLCGASSELLLPGFSLSVEDVFREPDFMH